MKKLPNIIEILRNLNYLSEITPFFFCLLFFKRIDSKEIKVFFVYTIVAVIFLAISLTAVQLSSTYLAFWVRCFQLLEFILISIVYISILKSYKSKQFIVLSICLYLIYWLYNLYRSNFSEFDFMPLVVECLFFTMLIVYYFYDVMRHNFTVPLYQLTSFWLSVAFLIYFSGNFFLFLYSNSIRNDPGWVDQYTVINSVIAIVKNILLCVAILVNNKQFLNKQSDAISVDLNPDSFKPFNKSINP